MRGMHCHAFSSKKFFRKKRWFFKKPLTFQLTHFSRVIGRYGVFWKIIVLKKIFFARKCVACIATHFPAKNFSEKNDFLKKNHFFLKSDFFKKRVIGRKKILLFFGGNKQYYLQKITKFFFKKPPVFKKPRTFQWPRVKGR